MSSVKVPEKGTDDWYRMHARRVKIHMLDEALGPHGAGLAVDILYDAPVSKPSSPPNGPGAWVQAWIWVPDVPKPEKL